jgi:hypothetical protein
MDSKMSYNGESRQCSEREPADSLRVKGADLTNDTKCKCALS